MKLSKEQNARRKELKKLLAQTGGQIFSYKDELCTVLVCPSVPGDNVRFCRVAISFCAPSEDKFKRKIGEANVLDAWIIGQTIPVATRGFTDMMDIADSIVMACA